MRLLDLLCVIGEYTNVWISDDPFVFEGIYFGQAKDVPFSVAAKYKVVSVYPERYPAISNFMGISIIVSEN